MFAGLIQRCLLRTPLAAVPASSGSTWAAATDYTLTNGNLTAERTADATTDAIIFSNNAKTNGTIIFTIDNMGSGGFRVVGVSDGTETLYMGAEPTGKGIGWFSDGNVFFESGVAATYATWTAADALKIVKAAGVFTFYKNNVLQGTFDAAAGDPSAPVIGAAKFAAYNSTNAALGYKVTVDGSGW